MSYYFYKALSVPYSLKLEFFLGQRAPRSETKLTGGNDERLEARSKEKLAYRRT